MDEKEIKEIAENIGKLAIAVDDVRKRMDDADIGEGEFKTELEKIGKELAENVTAVQGIELLQKRLDEVETRYARLQETQNEAGVKPSEHHKAILDALSCGFGDSSIIGGRAMRKETIEFFASDEYKQYSTFIGEYELETRTLTETVATAGGVFVSPEIEAEILKNVVDVDPVRSVAQIRAISTSDRLKGFRRVGTPTAAWETEIGSGSDSEPKYTDYEIPVHAMVGKTPISGDLLADVGFVEREITVDMAEQFSYTEGIAFVEGHGAGQPMGFTNSVGVDAALYPATVTSTGTAATDAVQPDDIPKMWGTLKARYRANATWAFNSNTYISLLSLADTAGRYYMMKDGGLISGPPNQMYGRPFIICETLPNEGSEVYPLWLGDFKAGYRIVDRSGIQLLRDIYTIWPRVYFKMRSRVGAQVVKPEAIKGLKTS